MGLFSFIKEAGEKLFGGKKVEEAAAANDTASLAQLNAEAGAAMARMATRARARRRRPASWPCS